MRGLKKAASKSSASRGLLPNLRDLIQRCIPALVGAGFAGDEFVALSLESIEGFFFAGSEPCFVETIEPGFGADEDGAVDDGQKRGDADQGDGAPEIYPEA